MMGQIGRVVILYLHGCGTGLD